MSNDRWAGLMLMAGSAGVLLTLGLHPSGRELFSPDTFEDAARKLIAVHSLALAALPLWFLGASGLSRHLGTTGDCDQQLGSTALAFYGFGLVAMTTGVILDGLVSPGIAGKIISTTEAVAQGWKIVFNYNGILDEAFLHVFLVAA